MISSVTVAPLVLLSVVDHYNRIAKDSKRRVVGVILGSVENGVARVANSFAVPFEEDPKNSDVWFLDHNYIEGMQAMFRKVNANEKLIGWYHSGPKLRANDLQINELFKRYTPNPLLLIVDVIPKEVGIPTDAYIAVDEIKADGTASGRTFVHIPSEIKAEEAEEIGVEHLLRDVHNIAAGALSTRITNQLQSLHGLGNRLGDVASYLDNVLKGDLPVNHAILGELQDVFNLLPNLNVGPQHPELGKAFTQNTNDQLMIVYVSSVVRAILSFHDMIDNKIQNKERAAERERERLALTERKNPSAATAATSSNSASNE